VKQTLGQRVINDLVSVVVQTSIPSKHQNFFTNCALLTDWRDHKIIEIGTLQNNVIVGAANAMIVSKRTMKS